MRILIVDDHEIVLRGVRTILSSHKELEVCGEAVDGSEAIEKARQLRPDAIIMDLSMPKMDGFTATREIKKFLPDVSVIILSIHNGREAIVHSKLAGAQAYVRKMEAGSELLKAFDAVQRKKQFFPSGAPSTPDVLSP